MINTGHSPEGGNMKKVLFLVAVLLLLAGSIIAKGTNEKSDVVAEKSNEITVVYLFDPPWYEQAAEFTKQTGIKVNYVEVTFPELRQRSLTSFLSQETRFDVIHLRSDWVAEFAEKGFLEPISQYIAPEVLDGYSKSSLENLSWKGELYGLPRYYWLWQLYYNKEVLQKAGIENIPENWNDLINLTPTIKKTGAEVLLGGLQRYNLASMVYILVRGEGGNVLNEEGKAAINSPEGIKALETLKKLYDTGTLSRTALEMDGTGPATDLFMQGGYAFLLSTPHTYPMAQDSSRSKLVDKVGVGLIPSGSVSSAAWNEPAGVGIPYNSRNKEDAAKFLQFVTSAEQQKTIALKLGRIPTREEVLKDPDILAKYPHFASIEKQIAYPNGIIKSAYAQEILDAISETALKILYNQVSIESGLASLEKEINTIAEQ